MVTGTITIAHESSQANNGKESGVARVCLASKLSQADNGKDSGVARVCLASKLINTFNRTQKHRAHDPSRSA